MISITVYDFLYLCCEPSMQIVKLYDIDNEKYIYEGTLNNMPNNYQRLTVQSWDCLNATDIITINISFEDD